MIVVAAVVGVDGAFLMFGVTIEAAGFEIMRHTQNSVVAIEQIDFAVAVAVHGDIEV